MMDVVLSKLDRLSGDAVKLALWLDRFEPRTLHAQDCGRPMVDDTCTCDLVTVLASADWVAEVAKKIAIPPAVVRKSLSELVNHGALHRSGRSRFCSEPASVSYPHPSLALRSPEAERSGADGPGEAVRSEDEVEAAPWERSAERDARTRGSAAQGRSVPLGMGTSVRGSDATPRSPSLKPSEFCVTCGAEAETPWTEMGRVICTNGHRNGFGPAHKVVIDIVVAMYADCYEGAKLGVSGKAGAIVKRLLTMHSPAEIVRRARIMFYEPRRWPSPPYHFGSLSVHFDSFVPMKKSSGGMADRDRKKTGATYYGEVDDV